MAILYIGMAENGQTLELKVQDQVQLSLPENPTTGFRWVLDQIDPHLLLMENSFQSQENPSPGAAGTAMFLLKAIHPGTGILSLKLWRSWSGDASIIQRFQIGVRVTA